MGAVTLAPKFKSNAVCSSVEMMAQSLTEFLMTDPMAGHSK